MFDIFFMLHYTKYTMSQLFPGFVYIYFIVFFGNLSVN